MHDHKFEGYLPRGKYLVVEERRREKKTLKTVISVNYGRLCVLVSVYALLAKQETN